MADTEKAEMSQEKSLIQVPTDGIETSDQDSQDAEQARALQMEALAREAASLNLTDRLAWAETNYRNNLDTDLDWLHRKAFLAAHVGRYPLTRLEALACCYANSVVLGCRYPAGVMNELQQVEDITIGAVEELLRTGHPGHLRGGTAAS